MVSLNVLIFPVYSTKLDRSETMPVYFIKTMGKNNHYKLAKENKDNHLLSKTVMYLFNDFSHLILFYIRNKESKRVFLSVY